jgi:hypothetical protein
MKKINCACQITKNVVYIQNQVKLKSLNEKWNGSQDELIDPMGIPLKWCLEVSSGMPWGEMRSDENLICNVFENFFHMFWCSLFKKLVWSEIFSSKWLLDPFWLKIMCLFSHTLAPLSLSKWKWCKWGSREIN